MVPYIRVRYSTCGLVLCCFTSASTSFIDLSSDLTRQPTGTSKLVTLKLFPESPSDTSASWSRAKSPAISTHEQAHAIFSSNPPDLESSSGLPPTTRSTPNLSQYAALETQSRSSNPVRPAGPGSSSGHVTNVSSPAVNPLAHSGVKNIESHVHLSKTEPVSVIICPVTKASSASKENKTGDVSSKGEGQSFSVLR